MRELEVVIVDDEPLARRELRDLLGEIGGMAIAGEAADGRSAVAVIESVRPHVVLLDVELPEMSGFDVLRCLKEDVAPFVIFVTAYDHYAVRAFEAEAVDYLLKPIEEARLRAALARARTAQAVTHSGVERPRMSATLRKRVVVRKGDRILFLKPEEIDWIEAVGNYVKVHRGAENYLMRINLGAFEKTLPPEFVRIQRSSIVNVNRVAQLIHQGKDSYVLVLTNGTTVALGPTFRKNLEAALGKF